MIDGVVHLMYTEGMPNLPDPCKTMLHLRIPREMYEQLKKLAHQRKTTISQVVLDWIILGVQDVPLTEEDHENIAEQIRRAKEKR